MNEQNSATNDGDELDIRALLRPLRTRWWLVLLIVVIATAAAYVLDARRPKVYEASTSVYVNLNDDVAAQFSNGSQQFDVNSPNQLSDLATLLQSSSAAASVAKRLHGALSPGQVQAAVNVSASETADFIAITAKASSPQLAAGIANAYARVFIHQGQEQVAAELSQLQLQTNDQINALPAGGANGQRSVLLERLKSLQSAKRNPDTAEQQIGVATPPSNPISPNPKKVAIFAFFLSLLASLVIVYLLERLDQRLKDLDGLTSLYKLPLLAVVPHSGNPEPQVDGVPTLPAETIEAIRMLRMSVGLQSLDAPPRVLLITSAMPAEGKTTVSRDLALVYREAGVDVALIDADLRRGSLTAAFAPNSSSPGLTGILLGETPIADAQVDAKVALPSDGRRGASPEGTDIPFIPSGGPASNPPAILGSMRMASLLQELADEHELLIIDSPPLLPVSDTLPLLSMVDGVILVARVNVTRRDAVKRTRAVLSGAGGARVIGLVANDIAAAKRAYLYGYEPPRGGFDIRRRSSGSRLVTSDTRR